MCYIQYTVYTVYILCVTSSILLFIDINVMCSFLSCSVLFCATRCYAVTSCWIPTTPHAMLCYMLRPMLRYSTQCISSFYTLFSAPPYATTCYAMLRYDAMLSYATCDAMLPHATLRRVSDRERRARADPRVLEESQGRR